MKNIKSLPVILLGFLALPSMIASYATDAVSPSYILKVDTLQQAGDSISLQTVTSAVSDSATVAVPDSAAVAVSDSTSVAVSDSASVAVSDSVAIAVSDTLSQPKPRVFKIRKLSDTDKALLTAHYKEMIAEDITPEAYRKAYTPWRSVFCSSDDRTLDLYIDGVGILMGNISLDTLERRGENMHIYTNELMELYDLAVENIDSLNAQIDFTKTKDSLSVAKLRAQQVTYYRRCFEYDSILNSSHHNKDFSDENLKYWEDVLFKDSIQITKLYPWYRGIIMSDETDIKMEHLGFFAKLLHFKIGDDVHIGKGYAKKQFEEDRKIIEDKIEAMIAAQPDKTEQAKIEGQSRGLEITLNQAAGQFVDVSNFAALEAHFRERLDREGPAVWEDILASNLSRADSSSLYLEALRNKYETDPSYEIAINIAQRSTRVKRYSDAITYYQRAIAYPEFYEMTEYQQARIYVFISSAYQQTGGSTAQRYPYLKDAIEVCPEYPEPYFQIAYMIMNVNLRSAHPLIRRFRYCVAYDQLAIVLQKVEMLEANPESEVKTTLNVAEIRKAMASCKSNFPTKDDLFMQGPAIGMEAGKSYPLNLPFGKYKAIVRTSD